VPEGLVLEDAPQEGKQDPAPRQKENVKPEDLLKRTASQFPHFSFDKFESDMATDGTKFHDLFGDGQLVIQVDF
jgi:hypothetical protein